jgi:hypothetical protein
MKRWMKWAAVAAVGLVAVPVMGLSMAPSKASTKTAVKPSAKVTPVSNVSSAKKTSIAPRPVTKSTSPRPASVRLGKNPLPVKNAVTPKTTKHVTSGTHTTLSSAKNNSKSKPVMVTKTPIRPTTLHSGPSKLPAPKSTLSKAMEKTHTPSSPSKSKPMVRTEMN